MRARTFVTLAVGVGVGYITGAAAGRPAYERMKARLGTLTEEFGLRDAGARVSSAAKEAVEFAAERSEERLIPGHAHDKPATASSTDAL